MANALIQFRADEKDKIKAVEICSHLGIDLSVYLRMCMTRLIRENGVPFSMKVSDIGNNKGIEAIKTAGKIAKNNGIADMTLEEINAEIADYRRQG